MIAFKQCLALAFITLAGGVLAALYLPQWLLVSMLAVIIILIGVILLKC